MTIRLTELERETMQDLANGLGTKDIMQLRHLSKYGIKYRINGVLKKIGEEPDGEGWNNNRTQALIYLILRGIVEISPNLPTGRTTE